MQTEKAQIDREPDGSIRGKAVRSWCLLPSHGSLLMKVELHELDPTQEGQHRSFQIGLTGKQAMQLVEQLQVALRRITAQRPQGSA